MSASTHAFEGDEDAPDFGTLIDEVRQTATDVGTMAVRVTRQQPLLAVSVAAMVGFAIGGGLVNRYAGRLVLAGLQAAVAKAAKDRFIGRRANLEDIEDF